MINQFQLFFLFIMPSRLMQFASSYFCLYHRSNKSVNLLNFAKQECIHSEVSHKNNIEKKKRKLHYVVVCVKNIFVHFLCVCGSLLHVNV